MKKLITEFVGTFFLVLTIGCAVQAPSLGALAPLAIGVVLIAMLYAGGHISGAHYNPAVTLGVWINGKISTKEAVMYAVAQILAGAVAALCVNFIRGSSSEPGTLFMGPAFLAEFLFSFALVFVVLNVAVAKSTQGNPYFGAAIGLTVMAGAFAVGDVSGGAFNPAVVTGLLIMGLAHPGSLVIYLPSILLGGAVAGLLFKALHPQTES
ncbi:MAG: MIP/aquaporin family protein [Candidatus Methylacidiphilales bacterium]